MPAASNSTRGLALTSVRRLRATQPDSPSPTATVAFEQLRRIDARRRSGSAAVPSGCCRNSAQPDHGMIFVSFDEISAIVSETPRLVPIDWAISYSA